MIVVVPFVEGMLSPDTVTVLACAWRDTDFVAIDRDDHGAYGQLIRSYWHRRETFAICEQDVVPTRWQLEDLARCPGRWCSFLDDSGLYPDGPMFQLVKFSHVLLKELPMVADDALITGKRRDQEARWWECDRLISRNLEIRRVVWCLHDGRVRHDHKGAATVVPEG